MRRTARTPPLIGRVAPPGDKSISHRALLVSAVAAGTSTIAHLNEGHDVAATQRAIGALGARVRRGASGVVEVEGCGGAARMREPADVIDAGNSGTTLRCLLGICAGVPGMTVVTGDASLRARPMLRVVVPLRQMGAVIDGSRHGDRAPLYLRGAELTGIEHVTDVASAQVKTALLLAGLAARGTTTVTEPRPSRDHTERMLIEAGIQLERAGTSAVLEGGQVPDARDWRVPGDVSAALFLVVAALLVPGSDLVVDDVGLNPTRTAAVDVLRSMGADIEIEGVTTVDGEPVGRVRARHSELRGVDVPAEIAPALIDEVPALAVAALGATGTTTFRGVGELRVKESDRIAALVEGIRDAGGTAADLPDGLEVTGGPLGAGAIDPRGDHRIAMAFAVAGLVAAGKVTVKGWSCVDTSFPGFLETLAAAQRAR